MALHLRSTVLSSDSIGYTEKWVFYCFSEHYSNCSSACGAGAELSQYQEVCMYNALNSPKQCYLQNEQHATWQ